MRAAEGPFVESCTVGVNAMKKLKARVALFGGFGCRSR